MAEKFDPRSAADMMNLVSSPAGQQLLSLLRQSGGDQLQQAAGKAAAGDMTGARELLSPLLSDPRVRALLEQLGGA